MEYQTCLYYHPYLVSLLFADLLYLYLITFLTFFVTFLWCKFEIKFVIYHRVVKTWSSQASSVDVCGMGWRITNPWHLFKHRVNVDWQSQTNSSPVSMHTDCISNSANLSNDYASLLSALCTCVQLLKKRQRKWSHSSIVTSLNRLMRLWSCEKVMGLVHCSV